MMAVKPEDALKFYSELKTAFALAFSGPHGATVIAELSRYCCADRSDFHTDPRISVALQGRRQVWIHIKEFLDYTPEQLVALKSTALEGEISHARSIDDN